MSKKIGIFLILLLISSFLFGCESEKTTINNSNEEVPFYTTDEKLFEIETPYCSLYYPITWKDQIVIEFENEEVYAVKFLAKTDTISINLFDLYFGGNEGTTIGVLTTEDGQLNINMVSYELQLEGYSEDMKIDICGMNEDVNVIVSKLIELYDFVLKTGN